jgi:hypothetical protein
VADDRGACTILTRTGCGGSRTSIHPAWVAERVGRCGRASFAVATLLACGVSDARAQQRNLARLAENAVRNYDLQRAVELLTDIRALCVSDERAECSGADLPGS